MTPPFALAAALCLAIAAFSPAAAVPVSPGKAAAALCALLALPISADAGADRLLFLRSIDVAGRGKHGAVSFPGSSSTTPTCKPPLIMSSSKSKEPVGELLRTIDFAARAHRAQRRKDPEGTPYINHPVGVAHILHAEGGERRLAVLQAAVLHDTVEDTATTFEDLEREFGAEVTNIVRECTDDKTKSAPERKQAQVDGVLRKSPAAQAVKLADKLYNVRDLRRVRPAGWTRRRVREYFAWAERVTGQVVGVNPALEEALRREYAGAREDREESGERGDGEEEEGAQS